MNELRRRQAVAAAASATSAGAAGAAPSPFFAANAVGAVSFCIGSRVRPEEKVFAATEIPVLLRNPNVDVLTKDVLAYYLRCMQTHQADMNMGLIRS